MKTITVIGANAVIVSSPTLAPFGNSDHIITGPEEMSVMDGYHTFEELYDHRITLFITLCRHLHELLGMENPGKFLVWRSKNHSDGEPAFGGAWFLLGIGTGEGNQITYHIPIERWSETDFVGLNDGDLEKAPKFDGHTSQDVIERLKNL